MSEITVENIEDADVVSGEGAPTTFAERLIERGDGEFVEPPTEPPVLERQSAAQAVETPLIEAPKKRGRPKGGAKPKSEAKKRGRPPKPSVEAAPEQSQDPPAPPIDLHALMEPLVQQYIAASHLRRESAKRQRYEGLFQNMMARRF